MVFFFAENIPQEESE